VIGEGLLDRLCDVCGFIYAPIPGSPKSAPAAAFPRARNASVSFDGSSAPPRDRSDAVFCGSPVLHPVVTTHAAADTQSAASTAPTPPVACAAVHRCGLSGSSNSLPRFPSARKPGAVLQRPDHLRLAVITLRHSSSPFLRPKSYSALCGNRGAGHTQTATRLSALASIERWQSSSASPPTQSAFVFYITMVSFTYYGRDSGVLSILGEVHAASSARSRGVLILALLNFSISS
jgi:hypothetical protein